MITNNQNQKNEDTRPYRDEIKHKKPREVVSQDTAQESGEDG